MDKPESESKKNKVAGYLKYQVVTVSVVLGFSVGLLSEILIDLAYGPSNLQEFISMQLTFLVMQRLSWLFIWSCGRSL